MLEELCRALSLTGGKDVVEFWEQLLAGPLTVVLQNTANSSLCTQACNVLATIGAPTMACVKVSNHFTHIFIISLYATLSM